MALHVIILAAGQGTRMKSSRPKVLHALAGKPLLAYAIDTARQLSPQCIHVVYGHGGETVRSIFDADDLDWVYQEEQHGTGHAVQLALENNVNYEDRICVLYGDVPLLSSITVSTLMNVSDKLGVLTARVSNPAGYGRIIRDGNGNDRIVSIVEERDADDQQKLLDEINTGVMAGSAGYIRELLSQVGRNNDQGEIYLTDIIQLATSAGTVVDYHCTQDETEITGINNKLQLAAMERLIQQEKARILMESGVTLLDPDRIDIRGSLTCGTDVEIDVNCIFEGQVVLNNDVKVGPNVYIKDSIIGKGTEIRANTIIEGSEIGENAIIGPFARIRPETRLSDSVHIGNFVEIKKSMVAEASKINHLSYVGDSTIGKRVNIGAGTITCNYDGAYKHQTVIEDDVFIGSGTELVAPIKVERGATTGAGSTLSKNVERESLVVERSKTRIVKAWQRPSKS